MIWLAILAAVCGAGANAMGSVLQHRSAGEPDPGKLFSRKFFRETVTHRLWLAGTGFDFLGFLLQALALFYGPLVLVEPIMTMDLIFLFFIIYFRYHIHSGRREWYSVVLICVGLSAMLVTADPSGARLSAHGFYVAIAAIFVALIDAAAALMMRRSKNEKLRTISGAVATGVNFSLTAVFTKLTVTHFSSGIFAVFFSWAFPAMILSSVASLIIMQSTYASGPIKLSQPIITIAAPATSILIGLLLFGTDIRHTPLALVIEAASAVLVAICIVVLADARSVAKFETTGKV
jgi:hypothetical protein